MWNVGIHTSLLRCSVCIYDFEFFVRLCIYIYTHSAWNGSILAFSTLKKEKSCEQSTDGCAILHSVGAIVLRAAEEREKQKRKPTVYFYIYEKLKIETKIWLNLVSPAAKMMIRLSAQALVQLTNCSRMLGLGIFNVKFLFLFSYIVSRVNFSFFFEILPLYPTYVYVWCTQKILTLCLYFFSSTNTGKRLGSILIVK